MDGSISDKIFNVSYKNDVRFAGISMQRGHSEQYGGGIDITSTTGLEASYVLFEANGAFGFGGAACMFSSTNMLFSGCIFSNNVCDFDDGGEVFITKGMGGGLAALESTLTVTNCLFNGNVAKVTRNGGEPTPGSAGGGGDIYLQNGDLTILASKLQGAIAGVFKSQANPEEGSEYFTGDGGSLLIHGEQSNTKLTIRDCEFIGARSYGNGGAISLSFDSSAAGRSYFVKIVDIDDGDWLPVVERPQELGGGCLGLISNTVFRECKGGWQGGAISANGRGMLVEIQEECSFLLCEAGATHLRDGKGGAVSVCGGIQDSDSPENHVQIIESIIDRCSSSGNGGGVYATIRGKITLDKTIVQQCSALNAATIGAHDFRMIEGMGGGVHSSAGGEVCLDGTPAKPTQIIGNTAAVSGGGLSAKSGDASVAAHGTDATVTITGNKANGLAADGYGNGGGVFVTTSRHDDNPLTGVGHGAAAVFNEDGEFFAASANLTIANNCANRWGGGLYAGISPPWYNSWGIGNNDNAFVFVNGATLSGNACSNSASVCSFFPAQIAAERVDGSSACLNFDETTVIGRAGVSDIGVYSLDSFPLSADGANITSVALQTLEE